MTFTTEHSFKTKLPTTSCYEWDDLPVNIRLDIIHVVQEMEKGYERLLKASHSDEVALGWDKNHLQEQVYDLQTEVESLRKRLAILDPVEVPQ